MERNEDSNKFNSKYSFQVNHSQFISNFGQYPLTQSFINKERSQKITVQGQSDRLSQIISKTFQSLENQPNINQHYQFSGKYQQINHSGFNKSLQLDFSKKLDQINHKNYAQMLDTNTNAKSSFQSLEANQENILQSKFMQNLDSRQSVSKRNQHQLQKNVYASDQEFVSSSQYNQRNSRSPFIQNQPYNPYYNFTIKNSVPLFECKFDSTQGSQSTDAFESKQTKVKKSIQGQIRASNKNKQQGSDPRLMIVIQNQSKRQNYGYQRPGFIKQQQNYCTDSGRNSRVRTQSQSKYLPIKTVSGNSDFCQTNLSSKIFSPYISVYDELQVCNREEQNYIESAHMHDQRTSEWKERDKFQEVRREQQWEKHGDQCSGIQSLKYTVDSSYPNSHQQYSKQNNESSHNAGNILDLIQNRNSQDSRSNYFVNEQMRQYEDDLFEFIKKELIRVTLENREFMEQQDYTYPDFQREKQKNFRLYHLYKSAKSNFKDFLSQEGQHLSLLTKQIQLLKQQILFYKEQSVQIQTSIATKMQKQSDLYFKHKANLQQIIVKNNEMIAIHNDQLAKKQAASFQSKQSKGQTQITLKKKRSFQFSFSENQNLKHQLKKEQQLYRQTVKKFMSLGSSINYLKLEKQTQFSHLVKQLDRAKQQIRFLTRFS